MNRAPSPMEQEVLDVLLKELRRALKMKGQLQITIDPFVMGGGVHIFASPNAVGRSYTFEERGEGTRKR